MEVKDLKIIIDRIRITFGCDRVGRMALQWMLTMELVIIQLCAKLARNGYNTIIGYNTIQ